MARIHIIALLIVITFFSCDEVEFLKENPLDFYAPENSYLTYADFDAAVYNLHAVYRSYMYDQREPRNYWDISDLATSFYYPDGGRTVDTRITPSGGEVSGPWRAAYRIIYDANVIIERSESDIVEISNEEKTYFQAEARFFRAYAYRLLGHLFGGVPIVLSETKAPKRDYVRATRQEVYEQCATDLEFAVANLPEIDEVDGSRINRLAASHVLTEIYISLERWTDAINEASKVIDDPATALMTSRFGSRVDEPGDVYWDLFRQGNQNRTSGNTEAIWVMQMGYNIPGGTNGNNHFYAVERNISPRLYQARITQSDGSTETIHNQPNSYVGGRGVGFSAPSTYFRYELWAGAFNLDIRNSSYNIMRDFQVMNPDNEYNGMWVFADNLPVVLETAQDSTRNFYPLIMKGTTPGRHPQEFWHADQTVPGALTNQAGTTLRDHYEIRLADTYLLRAEAHLGNGDPASAAADINEVRQRASAPDVTSGEVDIDYILDERLRELHYEEMRLITLMRLGKAVERIKSLNPIVGATMGDHMDLYPIPIDDIQKNTGAVLEQNPGYGTE